MTNREGYSAKTLLSHVGQEFQSPDPILVSQARINEFASSTGDTQWIHIDVDRAKRESPFGGPIAHGFLTLSILAADVQSAGVIPSDAKAALNYGLGKVRFLAPVPAEANVQASYKITAAEDKGDGRTLLTIESTLVAVGSDKPAVIAELMAMVIS